MCSIDRCLLIVFILLSFCPDCVLKEKQTQREYFFQCQVRKPQEKMKYPNLLKIKSISALIFMKCFGYSSHLMQVFCSLLPGVCTLLSCQGSAFISEYRILCAFGGGAAKYQRNKEMNQTKNVIRPLWNPVVVALKCEPLWIWFSIEA